MYYADNIVLITGEENDLQRTRTEMQKTIKEIQNEHKY